MQRHIQTAIQDNLQPAEILVAIAPRVDEPERLAAGLIPGVRVLHLGDGDPVSQIADAIRRVPTRSLHLICHGSDGHLDLGDTPPDADTLRQWDVGEICLYACNFARNRGQKFLQNLHRLTGVAIAASTRIVGNPAGGGTWDLDYQIGEILSPSPFTPRLQQTYPGTFATFTVTTTADDGPGSLRQAIADANASPEADEIRFDLFILDPNFNFNTDTYTIRPQSPLPAITGPVTIDGTSQSGFRGTPVIELDGSQAGGGSGLTLTGGNSTVRGLVINRFPAFGIEVIGGGGNVIEGNYIGTDSRGTTALGNGFGISISESPDNIIGTPENPNIISGHTFTGILIAGANATGNQIQGNAIGTDLAGTADLGNGRWGIFINAGDNAISNNTIAFNRRDAIAVERGVGNTIVGNAIADNGGLGIDLGDDDLTPNDPLDADLGPNTGQNFPTLTGAFSDGTSTTLTGTLNSTPESNFTLQFFSNTAATRQGRTLIGETPITTDSNGDASFTLNLPVALTEGDFVTATATNPNGDTSEFSGAIAAVPPATVNFSRATYRVNEDGIPDGAEITLDRTGDTAAASVLTLNLRDGTASGATPPLDPDSGIQDFDNTPQTVTFAPGETRVTLAVPINDDAVLEENEVLELVLDSLTGGASNAIIGDRGTATVTILDNENRPGTLEIGSPAFRVTEGTPTAAITVTRTDGDEGAVSATLNLEDGTARAPQDYTDISPVTVRLADGQTSATVNVPITDDEISEPNETFNVRLENATGGAAIGARSAATVTVEDDDNPAGLLAFQNAEYTVTEGTPAVTATVIRREGSSGAVSTRVLVANGSATAPRDFINNSPVSLELADGQTEATISVPIVDDGVFEGSESFSLFLDSLTGGASFGATRRATVTIEDNDNPPGRLSLEAAEYTVTEGTANLEVAVVRTGGSAGSIGADLFVRDGSAIAPDDYTDISPRRVEFEDGQTRQTVAIPILDDDRREDPETFTVSLDNATGGILFGENRTATATIEDNDNPPGTLAFESVEYNVIEGIPTASITITRGEGDFGAVGVELSLQDETAIAPEDYTNISPVAVEFADGQTSATVNIPIEDDAIAENGETVILRLDNPTGGANVGTRSEAVLAIEDDDNPVGSIQFAEADFQVDETDSEATLTLVRDGGSEGVLRVNVNLADDTATSPDDYINNSPLVVEFGDGQIVQTVTIPIVDDAILEDDETVDLILDDPEGGVFFGRQNTATLTVVDDEEPENIPPTITDISDTAFFQDLPAPPIPFTMEDAETPAQELTVTATSDNPTLIPPDGMILAGEGENRTVAITPAPGESGEAFVTLAVSDGEDTTTDEFLVTVGAQTDLAVRFAPDSGRETDESGGTVEFTAVLERSPTADVVVSVESSNPGEGVAEPAALTFTPDNWDVPQTVTVTGQADGEVDGQRPYAIDFVAAGDDPTFDGLSRRVALTNADVVPATIPEPVEVDTLNGGPGADVFWLRSNVDQLAPLSPPITQFGTPDPDSLPGQDGNDVIFGRGDGDTLLGFREDDFLDGQGESDRLLGGQENDIVIGNSGDDTVFGEKGGDTLYGGPEADVIYGNQEGDVIFGDGGADTIYGGQNNDSLLGGTGSDLLFGDKGDDTLTGFSTRAQGYTLIDDFDIEEDVILLSGLPERFRLELSPPELPEGTAIIRENLVGEVEAIAVVADVFGLDLGADYFRFS